MADLVKPINVGSDHTLPVVPQGPGGEVVVNVVAGDTVYYGDTPAVTAASNQGSLTSGGSATFSKQVWLWSASVSQVTLTNFPARNVTRAQLATTARGLIAEPFNLSAASAGAAFGTQVVRGSLVGLAAGDIVTNIAVAVSTAAAGTAPTLIKLGLVDTNGVVLAATANVNNDAKWTSTGLMQFPLASPYQVTADNGVYIAMLQNGVFGTTPLQILRVGGNPAQVGQQIGSGARLFAITAGGVADLTGPFTWLDSGTGVSYWFGVN